MTDQTVMRNGWTQMTSKISMKQPARYQRKPGYTRANNQCIIQKAALSDDRQSAASKSLGKIRSPSASLHRFVVLPVFSSLSALFPVGIGFISSLIWQCHFLNDSRAFRPKFSL
jgi:hypothetical protein